MHEDYRNWENHSVKRRKSSAKWPTATFGLVGFLILRPSPPTSEEGKQCPVAGNQEKRTTGGHSNGGSGGGVPKEDVRRVDSARCIELISQAGGGKQCPEVNQGLTLRAAVKNSDTSRLSSSNLDFVAQIFVFK